MIANSALLEFHPKRMSERNPPSPDRFGGKEPRQPTLLPPELAAFLRTQRYACLTHATEDGRTVLIAKAPRADLTSLRGPIPIEIHHERATRSVETDQAMIGG
jgi:hypothetical protein